MFEKFKRAPTPSSPPVSGAQTAPSPHPFRSLAGYSPDMSRQLRVFDQLRESLPVVDAALYKLVRLAGGIQLSCRSPALQDRLRQWAGEVPFGCCGQGLQSFLDSYFEQLLCYGTAVGEMVTDKEGYLAGLCLADLSTIRLKPSSSPFEAEVWVQEGGRERRVSRPQLILLSALNPRPGSLWGTSLLQGLPFVSDILLNIYHSIGVNWERMGNLRFAVTYKPPNDGVEKAYAKERAQQIAREWSSAMQSGSPPKDFVAVGDVDIRVIGADNQILDSQVPVRQMLEQIVAKTGLPPFLLGLNWSTTERMSQQQVDVLTSELEFYRRLLTPVALKAADFWMRCNGYTEQVTAEWPEVTLQDIVEEARAQLYLAQSEKVRSEHHAQ